MPDQVFGQLVVQCPSNQGSEVLVALSSIYPDVEISMSVALGITSYMLQVPFLDGAIRSRVQELLATGSALSVWWADSLN